MMRGEPNEDALMSPTLPFEISLTIMDAWIKDVDRTPKEMCMRETRPMTCSAQEQFFQRETNTTTRKFVANPYSIIHCQ